LKRKPNYHPYVFVDFSISKHQQDWSFLLPLILVQAELKHGRIAMLAWVGLVVPEFARIPGAQPSSRAAMG